MQLLKVRDGIRTVKRKFKLHLLKSNAASFLFLHFAYVPQSNTKFNRFDSLKTKKFTEKKHWHSYKRIQ